jgi:acyl-CoA thioesterase
MTNGIDDPINYAKNVVGTDPFASFTGIYVDDVKSGYAKCSLTILPQHLNAIDRAHGAIIYALADQALAVASNSTGFISLATNMNINYLASARDGERIFSEARPLNIGKKISVWKVEVRGANDRLIASAEGTTYHK